MRAYLESLCGALKELLGARVATVPLSSSKPDDVSGWSDKDLEEFFKLAYQVRVCCAVPDTARPPLPLCVLMEGTACACDKAGTMLHGRARYTGGLARHPRHNTHTSSLSHTHSDWDPDRSCCGRCRRATWRKRSSVACERIES